MTKHLLYIIFTFLVCISFNAFSQINNNSTKNDSIIKVEEKFYRNDGAGEAIIIERYIDDSVADKWVNEYLEKIRKKESNYLKNINASGCSNLDFESGDFSNWTCQTGVNNGYPAGSWVGTLPVFNRHTIVTGGTDPFGGFPCLAPGGNSFSVKLGNDINGAQAEQLIYSFIVQPQDTNFIYKYAVVFENPNHLPDDQPYFELKILDNNGNVLACSYQHYVASSNIPGFSNVGNVWYKPWTTQGVNLTSYVGQLITVIVTSADCSHGGHFGYGYIDFICPSSFTTNPDFHVYCENETSTTLYVPNIDTNMLYQWSTGQTTPSITINPQLYDNQSINCYIYPPNSYQCGFWYVFNIKVLYSPQVTIAPTNPILCYGQTTTTVTAQVTGGNPPFTYIWNNGANTPSITVGQGNYQVLVYDSSGCPPVSASVIINANTIPVTAYAGPDQTICNTQTSINLNGTVSGTSGGLWTGGNGTFSPSNTSMIVTYSPTSAEIQNGSVTLFLSTTGNGSCPAATDSVTIQFAQFTESVSISTINVNCYNTSSGSASINIVNGSPPYTFNWSTNPAQTTQTASNLSQGNYSVTITNTYGCSNIQTVSITQPQQLTGILTPIGVSCYGLSNGSITAQAFGGTPGYYYNWSNGYNGVTLTNVATGNYSCTITDANGCTYVTSTNVSTPSNLLTSINTFNNVLCYGESSGTATVAVTGGTSPYTYFWSSGAGTSQTATGLASGNYFVTVSDANGCSSTASIQITEPTQINISISTVATSCFGGNNGSATATVSGGTPGYMYSWSPYGGNNNTATGLISGNYVLTVTDSKGCQKTEIVVINQPSQLIVTTNNVSNVLCYGSSNGSASISVTGGTPNYTYQWLPSGGNSPIATGLIAGNYVVSVTDANSCEYQLNVFISQPPAALSATFTQNNVGCYGGNTGSITANPSGGTSPYTYFWQPNSATTQTISNLNSGSYFVTITDANGCSITNNINISQPGGLLLTPSVVQPTCGNTNGAATINVSGGLPPYSYLWTPGSITTSTINNIASGVYNILVTDFSGCSQSSVITINDAGGPSVLITGIQDVLCFGGNDGSATASVSGGTPPYTYSWLPYGGNGATGIGLSAGTFIVQVADANGCLGLAATVPEISQPTAISISSTQQNVTCSGANNGSINLSVSGGTPPYSYLWSTMQTTPNLMSLSPGTYQVTVTDFNNCTDVYSVNIVEPNVLQVSISNSQNVSCFGGSDGSATATVTGGTPPYTYLWSPGGSTSQTATGLTTGTHTVFVTDSKGCSGSASVYLNQPPAMNLITGFTNPSCYAGNDGLAWVFASGGTPPYSYNWTPIGGTNDTAFNLQAGTYIITVSDQNSCQSYMSVLVSQPSPVISSISNYSNIDCNGGTNGNAIVSVSGGTPAYQYLWSTGSTSPGISGLDNGLYTVTVTDSRGCTDSSSVTIFEPTQPLSVTINKQDVSCFGFNNGVATCVVTGGTAPYSYIWVPIGQFNSIASNLPSGTYTVSVTDYNGCQTFNNVIINEPPALFSDAIETSPASCYGSATGAAIVNAWGGIPPYTYNWNTVPAQTNQIVSNIYAGNYFVSITDANGCLNIDSVAITQPTQLTGIVVSTTDVSCYNGNNGNATVFANGGTPPYSFVWGTTPQQNGQSANNLNSGLYIVTITDNNNCQTTINVNINNATQIITSITGNNVICYGDSTTITATATGGFGSYLYYWNQGLNFGQTHSVSPLNNTNYIVYVYDQNGCASTPDTVTIYVKHFVPQNVNVIVNSPVCQGVSTEVWATAVTSAFDTLTYNWSNGLGPGLGPFIVAPSTETTYYLTVTNTCNVTVIDSAKLQFAPPPTIYFTADINQGCIPLTINITDSSYTTFDDINSWTWHFSDGTTYTNQNPTHTFNTADTFYVYLELETTGGCISSSANNPLPVYAFPVPTAAFNVNSTTLYLPNDPVMCTNASVGGVSYLWNFGDGNTSQQTNVTHNYENIGQYVITLTTTNMFGCVDSTQLTIHATGDIVFPNVFTPDLYNSTGGEYDKTDLSNHVFFPYATGISDFNMLIFNRWGELIFETNDINIGWDGYYRGHLCKEDVYVFKAKATFIDGRKVEKIGDVTLLR